MPFKLKAVSLYWELMFTRSLFETPDMVELGKLLNEVATLVDAGRIVPPLPKLPARSCLKDSDTVNVVLAVN